MLETEDRPTGHDPNANRRPPGHWLLVAAAVAVIAVVGALLIAAAGDDDEIQVPATTPTTAPARDMLAMQETGVPEVEPGRYFIDPDGDDTTPLRVTYDIAAEGWGPWIGGLKNREGGHSSFSITTVTNVVRDGCTGQDPLAPTVGPTVDDLATALTQLAPFQVAAAPTDVTLLGYPGKHLELTVPDLKVTGDGNDTTRRFADCEEGELRSWISPLLGGPFWGYNGLAGSSEEFWILDVEGTRLVLVQLTSPDTPAQDVAERDAIFDSMQIEP